MPTSQCFGEGDVGNPTRCTVRCTEGLQVTPFPLQFRYVSHLLLSALSSPHLLSCAGQPTHPASGTLQPRGLPSNSLDLQLPSDGASRQPPAALLPLPCICLRDTLTSSQSPLGHMGSARLPPAHRLLSLPHLVLFQCVCSCHFPCRLCPSLTSKTFSVFFMRGQTLDFEAGDRAEPDPGS